MNTFIRNMKKATLYLSSPFILTGALLILCNILYLIPIDALKDGMSEIYKSSSIILGLMSTGYISFFITKSSKKCIVAMMSILVTDIIYSSFSGYHLGILFCIIVAFIIAEILKNNSLFYGYIITMISGMLFAFLIGGFSGAIENFISGVCRILSGKGALFGSINNLYNIFFSSRLGDVFYKNDYSGSLLINGKIVTGVLDIFASEKSDKSALISEYLSGKYFVNIFLPIGAFVCVYKKLERDELSAFTIVLLLSVICGDERLFCCYLFMFNPLIYFAYTALIFISYYISSLIDIRASYNNSSAIWELFLYGDKWFYFILTGVILSLLSYFTLRLLISRFDIRSTRILPVSVSKMVKALGGEENIERLQGDTVIVKNPNLINILKIDCDIHENKVILFYDDAEILKEYF